MKAKIQHRYPKIIRKTLGNLPYVGYHFSNIQYKVKLIKNDPVTWSADYSLAHVILPVLKAFKEDTAEVAFPSELNEPDFDGIESLKYKPVPADCSRDEKTLIMKYNDGVGMARWMHILNMIIWSFERIVDEDDMDNYYEDGVYYAEMHKLHEEKIQHGLDLFAKYYRNLWW